MDSEEMELTAFDAALILSKYDFGLRETVKKAELIWKGEKERLDGFYQKNYRQFLSDLLYCMDCISDQKDFEETEKALQKKLLPHVGEAVSRYLTDGTEPSDFYFKEARIRMAYLEKKKYEKIKFKTLLAKCGYKRKDFSVIRHFQHCFNDYGLTVYAHGKYKCDLIYIDTESMLTLRLTEESAKK